MTKIIPWMINLLIWGSDIMKRFAIAAFISLTATSAFAADMAVKALPPVVAPIWSWTGFYIGADVGGDWARDTVSPTIADGGTFPRSNRLSPNGAFGGAVAGYNFQSGKIVFGIEGDLGYMSVRKSAADLLGGTEIDFIGGSGLYGDITGRLGLTVDRALFYAKGGYAFINSSAMVTSGIPGFTVGTATNFSGWTLGVGVEYKLTPAWSIKGEYLHFDFGSKNATLTSAAGAVFPYNNALTIDTVKFGVNYTFNSPIVAKY
jgi:outer membrane immunogenic protein